MMLALPGPETKTQLAARRQALTDQRLSAMMTVAAETQWPEAWQDDLYVHDAALLLETQGEMLWILRDHGTHLYPVLCENSGELHHARTVVRYHSGNHKLNWIEGPHRRPRFFHVHADGRIQEVDSDAAYWLFKLKGDHA